MSRVCRACFHLLQLHAEKDAQKKTDEPVVVAGSDPVNAGSERDQPDLSSINGKDPMEAPVRPKGLLDVKSYVVVI